jgi:hypothetical protein
VFYLALRKLWCVFERLWGLQNFAAREVLEEAGKIAKTRSKLQQFSS